MASRRTEMKLNTKLKVLTVTSVAGTLAMVTGVVMAPVLENRAHITTAAVAAVAGTIAMVASLKEVHRIDVELNKGE